MQQPRLDGPTNASSSLLSLLLASLPPLPLSAPLAQIMALPYVSDANRAPLVPNESLRRGSALFLHSSIPETPDSFSLLNHAFLREREGERSVEVYFFCFIFLLSFYYLSFYYLLSCSKGYCSIFVVVALFCFEKEFGTAKAGLRAVGNHRIVEFKMEKRWSVVSHG